VFLGVCNFFELDIVGQGRKPNQAAGISANQLDRAILRERNPSAGWFAMEF